MAERARPWTALRADLAARGLNAIGVATGEPYEGWLPGCRSVVVVGSGGPLLWRRFSAWVEADPERLARTADPLDAFVRHEVRAVGGEGPGRRWVFADTQEQPLAPIQELALKAGLGWRSRLWVILHPTFGPWLGLRAACFTTEELAVDGPLAEDRSPCVGCPAPCQGACPGGALDAGRLDWRHCTLHRARAPDCADRCHARAACPEGAAWRYPADAHRYHHEPVSARASWLARLGAADAVDAPPVDWAERAARAEAALSSE